jgi:hypothetical protein
MEEAKGRGREVSGFLVRGILYRRGAIRTIGSAMDGQKSLGHLGRNGPGFIPSLLKFFILLHHFE